MTAAQKKAKDNFKKAIAYRKKSGCSLKEAFAHVYGKKVGAVKKKAAPKKKAAVKKKIAKKAAPKKKAAVRNYGSHKDTASHNVKISVVSGIHKSIGLLQREYIAVFHLKNGSAENEIFKATSLMEAKKFANFYKRREGIKARVTVHLIKKN
jgi:hypothetical protein